MNDETKRPSVNQGRRRLTKAGLAAPAVLGTLASGKVLGAVPWKCTVSGQVSGNVSGHESEVCNTLGTSKANLVTTLQSQSDTRKLTDLGVPDYYHEQGNKITDNTHGVAATLLQILTLPAHPSHTPPNLTYGQKALVLLLNAWTLADHSLYPLTQSEAQKLFKAAVEGTHYIDTNPDVDWNYDHVKYFIDLLYH